MVECNDGNLGEENLIGNVIRVLFCFVLRSGGKLVLEMLFFRGVEVEEAMEIKQALELDSERLINIMSAREERR